MIKNGNIVTAENDEEVVKFREIHSLLNECAEAADFDERLDPNTTVIGPGTAQLALKVVQAAAPKLSQANEERYGAAFRALADESISNMVEVLVTGDDASKILAIALSSLTLSTSFFQKYKVPILVGAGILLVVGVYFLTRPKTVASATF